VIRLRHLVVASALLVVLPAAVARANIYTRVLHSYQATGSVPPCKFSSQQLQSALKGIDTYGAQYFADFSDAVQNALAARAGGSCSRTRTHAPATSTGRSQRLRLGSLTAATGASLPAPLLIMAGLAAAGVLAGLVALLWWWRGWDPRWAARWRHGWREAGYRAGGVSGDFDDWLGSD
jgi:hypothetical protein